VSDGAGVHAPRVHPRGTVHRTRISALKGEGQRVMAKNKLHGVITVHMQLNAEKLVSDPKSLDRELASVKKSILGELKKLKKEQAHGNKTS
jgi:hypothetical protein